MDLIHRIFRYGRKSFFHIHSSRFIHHDNDHDVCDAMFLRGLVAVAWKHFDKVTQGKQRRESARKEYLDSLNSL